MLQIALEQLFRMALKEQEAGRLASAESFYRQVLERDANQTSSLFNLGLVLIDAGRSGEALPLLQEVQRRMPAHPDPPLHIGNALVALDRLDEAGASFERAVACGDEGLALSHLALTLQDRGQIDEALACHRRLVAAHPSSSIFHGNLIFTLLHHPQTTAEEQLAEARRWDEKFARGLAPEAPMYANNRNPERPLRVGYVSADFRSHASMHFIVPLLRHHDPGQVEIHIYAECAPDESVLGPLRWNIRGYRCTLGMPDAAVAEIVRRDGIDVLVDMKLHTSHNRLLTFARKPAPVQVTWLGYPGTTGMRAMDYRLTDPYLDPPGEHDDWYAEKSVRLADTFWCYDPLIRMDSGVRAPPAEHSGVVTFGCMNKLRKVNAGALGVWREILHAVPESRLLMLAPAGQARQWIIGEMAQGGIGAERLVFEGRKGRREYLELYDGVDIVLDTFPYNGHTTNLDSFWMGVPVVTMVGRTVVGRGGYTHLMNLGLPELAAQNQQQYVEIAVGLARDLPRLRELRAGLRQRMEKSALMDGNHFARSVEAAYRKMWRQWCGVV